MSLKNKSKFLSLILRHKPEQVGLTLDANGWASVEELLTKVELTMPELEEIVETNDKKRFIFNEDNTQIRANQGHSIAVDLGLEPVEPPQFLYHGTAVETCRIIQKEGLKKMNRQHVHLSENSGTALQVGKRKGEPAILLINSERMHKDGFQFFKSENGVWLTNDVPVKYIHNYMNAE